MTKNVFSLVLLLVLVSCGKGSGSSRRSGTSLIPQTPAKETITQEAPLTPKEEAFVDTTKEDLNLTEASTEVVKEELQKEKDSYVKSNIMFCGGGGYSTGLEFLTVTCRSFKGDRIRLRLIGFGLSYAIHSDLFVFYAKKGSRQLKEGTYSVSLGAVHLGLGMMGLKITNDNESIDWRMKGLTLGLGFNKGIGRITVEKYSNK